MKEQKIRKVKRVRRKSGSRKKYFAGAVLCGAVFLTAVLFMGLYLGRQRQAEEMYASMRGASDVFTVAAAEEMEKAEQRRLEEEAARAAEEAARSDAPHLQNTVDFDALREVNEDIYSWIEIPGTLVDYPVLQHPTDDIYYLDHTVDHVAGLPGSIYTESIHEKDYSSPLTILYGHNMRNDTMFGSLHDYEDADKLEDSPYVYIYLPDRTLVYQVFAAVRFSDAYLPYYWDCENEEEFLDLIEELRTSPGNVNEEIEVTGESRVIVMCTCIGGAPSNRFLVAAVQIDEYEN